MAGRFVNPLPQFSDSTPTMYAGAKLFFYASGTSTKLDTYTTKALSVANSNPVVLDSAGRIPSDIFLQDLEYKVVLAPSTDSDPPTSPIWTADPVSHRDSALVAKTVTVAGSPNGTTAGTAGSSSILPDFAWDFTNSILYVCTTTGTALTAVWTALNASAAIPSVPTPQGRLTLTSGTPVLASDVVAGTAVYYTSDKGNLVPIYNGATMIPTEFAELTLTLSASHATDTLYDVFVFSNSGVLTLATGPAWSTSTAGSGARGTGASTTQLTRVKGLWVNAVSMTGRNGSTTYTIGANLATYLGTILIDGTAGQITEHVDWGQNRRPGPWNAYNRVEKRLRVGDSTSSWAYGTATIRAANGASGNRGFVLCGLAEEAIDVAFEMFLTSPSVAVSGSSVTDLLIGWNSLTAASGTGGTHAVYNSGTATFSIKAGGTPIARYLSPPSLGLNYAAALENVTSNTGDSTFIGGEASMLLSISWRG